MKTLAQSPSSSRSRLCFNQAFSLIEILVSMTLLSVIILGLVAMFGQTQQAFRSGLSQTDVLESARSLTDMLGRELQEARPSQMVNVVNFFSDTNSPGAPLFQVLPGDTANPQHRANVLQDIFFLTLFNRQWHAIGYHVNAPDGMLGELYRWSTNPSPYEVGTALPNYAGCRLSLSNFTRVADGVVHFRVRALDTNGVWMTTNAFGWIARGSGGRTNVLFGYRPAVGEMGYAFYRDAMPAYVDLEIGVLDPHTLARARSIPDPLSRSNYLSLHPGAVHIFRQRIPVPNADQAAYQ